MEALSAGQTTFHKRKTTAGQVIGYMVAAAVGLTIVFALVMYLSPRARAA
jgi:hypothetical protein